MPSGLLWGTLALYGLGIILTLPSVIRGRPSLNSAALTALTAGLVLNGTALLIAALRLDRLPFIDVQSALSFFAFNITLAFFLASRRDRLSWFSVLILPFVFITMLAAALYPGQPFLSTTLAGGWLIAHVSAMILGYTALFLTFIAAVVYLLQSRQLKSKHPGSFYYRLPSLEVCDRLYDRSLVFGLLAITVGILTGCVWASRAWHAGWELDPKILASLFTWLIYLVLFSTRFSGSWRGRRSAYVAIFGFAVMMVTFLGASFLSSQHGYFPTISRIH